MRKVKVAVVIGETFRGGVGMAMLNYFRHLDPSRFVLDFLVHDLPGPRLRQEVEARGGKVIGIPSRKHLVRWFWTLFRIFKREKYDIVHSNLTTLNPFVLSAAKLSGVKRRISHCHSSSNPYDRMAHLAKLLLRPFARFSATDLFTCSNSAGQWLFGKRAIEQGRVKLIKNAIELEGFRYNPSKREELRRELKLEGKFVIGHVGRITVQKNHEFLVRVFNEALKLNPDARLLLIGDGELYWDIKVQVALMGIADKVIFTGNKANVSDYYHAMDVFLFPSLFEGLSVVLVEAQANGLPCLVSANNSSESKITDMLGFLPLTEPPEIWAKQCLALKRGARSDVISQIIAAGYDIRSAVQNLEAMYGSIG